MSYLFTSESVSEGHPDKMCDQISDALLDAYLTQDPDSRVACETLVTRGLVVCAGEVSNNELEPIHIDDIVRSTIAEIGYTKSEYEFDSKSCGVITAIHQQSPDIARGVVGRICTELQGAGDQGIMFGYACNETENYMPITLELANMLMRELAAIRKEGKEMTYLRPDSKAQVTVMYSDDGKPLCINTIVLSTQHDPFSDNDNAMQEQIENDVREILIPRVVNKLPEKSQKLFDEDFKLLVNPTGRFVLGGPSGDTGLTGRKIIVDTYGGHGAHGGGAFSGKDPSKVDRSAAYAARYIAKNIVAAGLCDRCLVQIAYAIGCTYPVGFYINTFGTLKFKMSDGEFAKRIRELVHLRPYDIIEKFQLKNPIYKATATYGHFGRTPYKKTVEVHYRDKFTYKDPKSGKYVKEITFFPWEKLDLIPELQKVFCCDNCEKFKVVIPDSTKDIHIRHCSELRINLCERTKPCKYFKIKDVF